ALLIFGSFATSIFVMDLKLPFALGVVAAMVVIAVIAVALERVAIRPMVGRPPFSAAIVTVGLFIALLVIAFRLFESNPRLIGDPWRLNVLCLGGSPTENMGIAGCDGGVMVYQNAIARIVI